jgi:hypothetical protein
MAEVGTPAPLLLPAGNHKFEAVTEQVEFVVPLRGKFPEDFPLQGEFDLSPAPGVLLMGRLVEVLFAFRAYPAMASNQRFILAGLEMQEEELVVVGRIVKIEEEK